MAYIYMMLIRRTIAPSKENKRSQIGYNPLAEGFHLERPMTTIISFNIIYSSWTFQMITLLALNASSPI